MCLYPRLMTNPKYRRNKKNGGVIPPVPDKRVQYVPIGCGVCLECRNQKARNWKLRLMEDIKEHKNGKFVTLTFSTEGLQKCYSDCKKAQEAKGYDIDNHIVTWAVRHFLERWRWKYKKSLRHWLITELGDGQTEHVHLHGIVWANDLDELENIWQYGFVWKGYKINGQLQNYVNERTVGYITKYVTKIDDAHPNYKSIILCSPGIGKYYATSGKIRENRYQGEKTNTLYRMPTGHKIAMPIYWRNKIYTDAEREKLWLQMLDKQERYVCGERIDISNGEKLYEHIADYHRERTIRLGYKPPEFIWSKKEYEQQRRTILLMKRLGIERGNYNGLYKIE